MPVLAMSAGKVTAIWGQAYLQLPNGTLRPLQIGDQVGGGTRIITDEEGIVQIMPTRGPSVFLKSTAPAPVVERAIAGIESEDPRDVPAAGLDGGGAGSLRPGLRVDRVSEATGPAGPFTYAAATEAGEGPFGSSADQRTQILDALGPGLVGGPDQVDPPGPPEPVRPGVSVGDVVVNEGAGVAVFTVTLEQASTEVVKVRYATQADTADAGDFEEVSGELTFQPGQTSLEVRVPIRNDGPQGMFEGDGQGEGRERFVLKLTSPTGAVLTKDEGVALIRDDGTGGGLPAGQAPDDDRPRVASVEVVAADNDYVYYGIRLDHSSEFPVRLTIESGPGEEGSDEAWTGGMEYSLDALTGPNENITFVPTLNETTIDPASGPFPQPTVPGNNVALIVLPPGTPTGLILVKVPAFLQDDPNVSQGDDGLARIKLTAATQYEVASKSAEATMLNGDIAVLPGVAVEEGGTAIFQLMLSSALAEDLKVKLQLTAGDEDPVKGHDGAEIGVDTGALTYSVGDTGVWSLLGADGIVRIPEGEQIVHVRVATVDDAVPEGLERLRLTVSGLQEGVNEVLWDGRSTAQLGIRESDGGVDPVKGVVFDPVRSEDIPLAGAIGQGMTATASLDVRDLLSDGQTDLPLPGEPVSAASGGHAHSPATPGAEATAAFAALSLNTIPVFKPEPLAVEPI